MSAFAARTTVDRRREYYARVGEQHVIAQDPVGFYARAESGRRWQFMTFQIAHEYARMEAMTAECVEPEYEH